MGMLRVSPGGAVLESAFLAAGAVVGPRGSGAGLEAARSIRPQPRAAARSRLRVARPPRRGAARRSTGSRRTLPCARRALLVPGRLSGVARPGRGWRRTAVDGLGDLGGFPLDPAEGAGGQQPAFDGVAERAGEHRPLAASGGRGARWPRWRRAVHGGVAGGRGGEQSQGLWLGCCCCDQERPGCGPDLVRVAQPGECCDDVPASELGCAMALARARNDWHADPWACGCARLRRSPRDPRGRTRRGGAGTRPA